MSAALLHANIALDAQKHAFNQLLHRSTEKEKSWSTTTTYLVRSSTELATYWRCQHPALHVAQGSCRKSIQAAVLHKNLTAWQAADTRHAAPHFTRDTC
jgi:hypothetical protein